MHQQASSIQRPVDIRTPAAFVPSPQPRRAPTGKGLPPRRLESKVSKGVARQQTGMKEAGLIASHKFLVRSAGLAMSRWDGGRGDLGESAGDGLSVFRPAR